MKHEKSGALSCFFKKPWSIKTMQLEQTTDVAEFYNKVLNVNSSEEAPEFS